MVAPHIKSTYKPSILGLSTSFANNVYSLSFTCLVGVWTTCSCVVVHSRSVRHRLRRCRYDSNVAVTDLWYFAKWIISSYSKRTSSWRIIIPSKFWSTCSLLSTVERIIFYSLREATLVIRCVTWFTVWFTKLSVLTRSTHFLCAIRIVLSNFCVFNLCICLFCPKLADWSWSFSPTSLPRLLKTSGLCALERRAPANQQGNRCTSKDAPSIEVNRLLVRHLEHWEFMGLLDLISKASYTLCVFLCCPR